MEYKVTWDEIKNRLLKSFGSRNTLKFYGIPRGGSVIAAMLNPVSTPEEADIIIDDLIDSGKTMMKYKAMYPDKPFFGVFDKQEEEDLQNKWLVFPWEESGKKDAEDMIIRILEYINENPNREGLKDTPARIVRMYKEIFRGYDLDQKPKMAIFKNGQDGLTYDQMITDTGSFFSMCEHHMMPFFGSYYFAYIPSKTGNILGLSKVARVVDFHSARLQIQERLVTDIMSDLWQSLGDPAPIGMGLVLKAQHLCKSMRGAKKAGEMRTTHLLGAFLTDPSVKSEFMNGEK